MTMPDQRKLIEDLFAALHSIDHKLGELIDLTRGEKLARVSAARQRAEQPRSPFADPPVDVETQIERVLSRHGVIESPRFGDGRDGDFH